MLVHVYNVRTPLNAQLAAVEVRRDSSLVKKMRYLWPVKSPQKSWAPLEMHISGCGGDRTECGERQIGRP